VGVGVWPLVERQDGPAEPGLTLRIGTPSSGKMTQGKIMLEQQWPESGKMAALGESTLEG
jgi:hypothetical protein